MTRYSFRLLDTGLLSAAENMALDEIIVDEVASGRSLPTFRFLRFSPPAALVGRHQDLSREIREDFCRDNGIDVNRRITGGGSLYFQTSALGWEIFGRQGDKPFNGSYDRILEKICLAAAEALNRLGVEAQFRPRNDIEVQGRKISGTGGVYSDRGYMFQGTLLIENEIELFLKSLRVPVEKLKKREIESLQQRMCFLSDLLGRRPPIEEIKDIYIQTFSDRFNIEFIKDGLTVHEKAALEDKLGYYESDEWVYGIKHKSSSSKYWYLYQTDAGTLRIHIWVEPKRNMIRQVLITGDFFCRPARFVLDLEASLKFAMLEEEELRRKVEDFYYSNDGEFIGISADQIIEALVSVVRKMEFKLLDLNPDDVNEIFMVNMTAKDAESEKLRWLLLPYCSKKIDCDYRKIPDCIQCGDCDFDDMYQYAQDNDLVPYSIQSFEHLMEVLNEIKHEPGIFIGSCCEAFYSKHQREMEECGATGLLVNLDSTTCYDLGKGMDAYAGRFDNQTEMNRELIKKLADKVKGNGNY